MAVLIAAGDLGWQLRALCAGADPEVFWPAPAEPVSEALRICRNCEVRAECLEYALEHDERSGIWGGTTERTRARIFARTGRKDLCGNKLHPMDDSNVLTDKDGRRHCQACRKASHRKWEQAGKRRSSTTTQPRKAAA